MPFKKEHYENPLMSFSTKSIGSTLVNFVTLNSTLIFFPYLLKHMEIKIVYYGPLWSSLIFRVQDVHQCSPTILDQFSGSVSDLQQHKHEDSHKIYR